MTDDELRDELERIHTTAAALMREQHGIDHPRHEFWALLADWLDIAAEHDKTPCPAMDMAAAVAHAYLRAMS